MPCKCDAKIPFTINAEIVGKAQLIEHDGSETLRVPVVAIVEGVLNGALVPADEFGAFAANMWEGVPVPVRHPEVGGVPVSANSPSVIESSVIGRLHNVVVDNKRLTGDLYINVESSKRKGFEAVLNALAAGEIMEVSTAYFCDETAQSGLHNNVAYDRVHTNLRPDHLALLPDAVGACSVKDGCGTFMANAWAKVRSIFIGNDDDKSYQQTEELIRAALRAGLTQADPYPYIVETYADHVIYELDSQLYRVDYTSTDGAVSLGSTIAVRVEKSYVPVEQTKEVETMPDVIEKPALTTEQLTAVNWAQDQYVKKQNALIAEVTANAANKLTEAQLRAMHVDVLESVAESLRPVDYSGRGSVVTTNAEVPEALPTLNVIL